MARVVALVPDLLFGSQVVSMLQAGGHDVAVCSEEDEVSVRRPGTVLSSSSSTSVTDDSMTRGLAPRRVVWTDTMGGSTSGNSRTESSR